jgi:hypothetical protein
MAKTSRVPTSFPLASFCSHQPPPATQLLSTRGNTEGGRGINHAAKTSGPAKSNWCRALNPTGADSRWTNPVILAQDSRVIATMPPGAPDVGLEQNAHRAGQPPRTRHRLQPVGRRRDISCRRFAALPAWHRLPWQSCVLPPAGAIRPPSHRRGSCATDRPR